MIPAAPEPEPAQVAVAAAAATPRRPEAAATMERLELRMLRARIVRDVTQVVALTAAAFWAVYVFWYQASYVPAHEVPNVVMTSSLEIVAERDDFVALRAKVSAHNPGRARVRIISESVSLVGARFSPGRGAPLGPDALPLGGTSWAVGSGVDEAGSGLLATHVDTPATPGSRTLEPNETLENTHVFRVSKGDWDVVTLTYYAAYDNLRNPAPNVEYERRFGPEGVVVAPVLPKGRPGTLSYSNTSSRAVVVLPR